MLSPESELNGEIIDEPKVEDELSPLTAAEQEELSRLYKTPELTKTKTESSIVNEIGRLGEFSTDPAELGAFLARHVGETYPDPVSGESTLRSAHLEAMDDIRTDIGQAIGLLREGGTQESIGRLVESAYGKISLLPVIFQNPMQKIIVRYYDNNKPKN